MIAPSDAMDIVERIVKSYRYDLNKDDEPDPICALMDIHDILVHSDKGILHNPNPKLNN